MGSLKIPERYTRTLLIQDEHSIERGVPITWVRHPGYLGSLLVLNGIALASGNWITLFASLVATLAAYTYRIKVEDDMLVAALGASYAQYRPEVGLLSHRCESRVRPDLDETPNQAIQRTADHPMLSFRSTGTSFLASTVADLVSC